VEVAVETLVCVSGMVEVLSTTVLLSEEGTGVFGTGVAGTLLLSTGVLEGGTEVLSTGVETGGAGGGGRALEEVSTGGALLTSEVGGMTLLVVVDVIVIAVPGGVTTGVGVSGGTTDVEATYGQVSGKTVAVTVTAS